MNSKQYLPGGTYRRDGEPEIPAPKQQDVTIEDLNQRIWKYVQEQDVHMELSRDLAIALCLKTSDLLRHYRWGQTPLGGAEAIGAELAGVLIYAVRLAQGDKIDIVKHIERQLQKSAHKVPESYLARQGRSWTKPSFD